MNDCHVRWMIRRDMPEVMEIERLCHPPEPWDEATMLGYLRQRNCIGMVAERGHSIVGFKLYELYKNHYDLVALAVHPDWQRRGVGRALMERMKSKLCRGRRTAIHIAVSEHCDVAHYFLRRMGFKATGVNRNFFFVGGEFEDAYHFRFVLGHPYRHDRALEEMLCHGK